MAKKRHTVEQIIAKIQQAEAPLAKSVNMTQVLRKLGITEQTYYRWQEEYDGELTLERVAS